MKKQLILFSSLLIYSYTLFAQVIPTTDGGRMIYAGEMVRNLNDGGSDINPANLGASKVQSSSFNLLQVGFVSHSNALGRADNLNFMFSQDSISQGTRADILQNLVDDNGNFKFEGLLNINWVSFSWTKPKFGGLAFSISDVIQSNFNLQPEVASVYLAGEKAEEQEAGDNTSHINYQHLRFASISYGRQAISTNNWKLYAGANYKVVWGIGHLDADINDSTRRANGQSAFSQIYDKRLNYGSLQNDLVGDVGNSFFKDLLNAAGRGSSFSLGTSLSYRDKFQVGLGILNVTRVKWSDRLATTSDAEINLDSLDSGIGTYNFGQEAGEFVYDFLGFEQGESFVTQAGGVARLNTSYKLTQALTLYGDALIPLGIENRAIQANNYIIGVDYGIIPDAIHISLGYHYNKQFGWRLPLGAGLAIGNGTFLSIATGDIRTLLSKQVEPYAALSVSIVGINIAE